MASDYNKYITFIALIALCYVLIASQVDSQASQEQSDVLVYVADNSDSGSSLMMFDPSTGEHALLYEGVGRLGFKVSTTGQVAIADWIVGTDTRDDGFYLLDRLDANSDLIDLGDLLGMSGNPLGWSPDGRYLAYSSYGSEDKLQLFLWDGERATEITPNTEIGDPRSYEIAWSSDGRLAFTVFFRWHGDSPNAEIFLWDGTLTHSMSQNPDGEDRAPTWSSTNRLAFLSQRDGAYGVYVWDGMTVADDLPDVSSFAEAASDVTAYFSYPVWTNEDDLSFSGISPRDERSQIYLWDGNTATNISQNPDFNNGGSRWADDGHWAFVTYFSSGQYIYIRNQQNETVMTNDGLYTSAWSSNNELIFCDLSNVGLSIWDGDEVTSIVPGWEIWAQWQSGQEVVCTYG